MNRYRNCPAAQMMTFRVIFIVMIMIMITTYSYTLSTPLKIIHC